MIANLDPKIVSLVEVNPYHKAKLLLPGLSGPADQLLKVWLFGSQ